MVALHHVVRLEVAGLRPHETVELVEPPLDRPRTGVAAREVVAVVGVVPLAGREGRIAPGPQQLGKGGRIERDLALVAGKPGVVVRQPPAAHAVRVLPGEQCGARRGAHRHGGVVGEPQAAGCERVDVGRVDLAAEAAEVRISHVIHQDHDHVGAAGNRAYRGVPVGQGLAERPADPSGESAAGRACPVICGHGAEALV